MRRSLIESIYTMNNSLSVAPPWHISEWFNTHHPIMLDNLRGQVIVLHAFQMLCPGCVAHGLPQALRLHRFFERDEVAVIGLHTVFEHHDVMGPQALRVFLEEYRISFPVGIDQANPNGPVPLTMQAYGLRGTPRVVVSDQSGQVRLNHFGQIDDLQLGALIGRLLADSSFAAEKKLPSVPHQDGVTTCSDVACILENPHPT